MSVNGQYLSEQTQQTGPAPATARMYLEVSPFNSDLSQGHGRYYELSEFLQADNNLSELANAGPARQNLGVEIGVDVQAWADNLDTLAGLDDSDGNFIVGSAGGWVVESGATARATLGLGTMATETAADYVPDTDFNAFVATLGTVAFSNSYNDLDNLPALVSDAASDGSYYARRNAAWAALATVAATGAYGDLSGTPALDFLPLIGGTLTGGLSIDHDDGLTFGASEAAQLRTLSEDIILENNALDKDLIIRLNDGGSDVDFVNMDASNLRIGFFKSPLGSAGTLDCDIAEIRMGTPRTANVVKNTRLVMPTYTASTGNPMFAFFGAQVTVANNIVEFGGGLGGIKASTQQNFWIGPDVATDQGSKRMTLDAAGLRIEPNGVSGLAASPLHVIQANAVGAVPAATFSQQDVDQPLMEFVTTIGTGNAIEAVGAKTLTVTHFGMIKLPGGLVRYFPIGTIA